MAWSPVSTRARLSIWFYLIYVKLLVIVVAAVGCQQAPTKINQTASVDQNILLKNVSGELKVEANTILVDARPAFEFSVAHAPGAVNLLWEDFATPNTPTPGKVPKDISPIAHRLALHGIYPGAAILVMGNGKAGKGEEGRVAWSLVNLGVRDVQIASIDQFRVGMTNAEPKQRENVAPWTPNRAIQMEADLKEVLSIATAKLAEGQRPGAYLLDVRSRKEYFLKAGVGLGYVFPDLRALHIPWDQFYNDMGRPNPEIKGQLHGLGWQARDRIIVVSNKGVRSGAAAFALMSMGFTNVANYTGGFMELLDGKKGPKERPPGK